MNKHITAFLLGLILFALAACGNIGGMGNMAGTGSTPPAGSIPVQITETDFHITSSVTNFVAGKTYFFIVTNHGQSMHEFMILPRVMGSMHGMSMQEMDQESLASLDMIDPGETQTLGYTFPASMAGTHPEFACHFPGHYEAGMSVEVSVSPA